MKLSKFLRGVNSAVFCIETDVELTFDDVFSGKYDDNFITHTGLNTKEVLDRLTEGDIEYIKIFINNQNLMLL